MVDPVDPPPELKPQGLVAEFLEILCNIMDETDGEGEEGLFGLQQRHRRTAQGDDRKPR
jgi:hypothetical protein